MKKTMQLSAIEDAEQSQSGVQRLQLVEKQYD